jgi:hypothetical protein
MDRKRFTELDRKVRKRRASLAEKVEYMQILRDNNSISPKQFEDFRNDINKDDLMRLGLIIGGTIFLQWMIQELFSFQSLKLP